MEQQTEPAGTPPAKKKHKKLIVTIAVILCVIITLGVFLMVWYWGDSYPDFEDNFRQEFAIPGLDDGFIPQGMGSYEDDGDTYFFISGYMNDGSYSRIYVVKNGDAVGYVTIAMDDSDDEAKYYDGHACGVATNGSKLWLVGESTVYVMEYSDVIGEAENNGSVTLTTTVDANCAADFCYYDGTYLYVGEFYRAGNYETDESHHITTSAGDENTAIIIRYSVSGSSLSFSRVYSITGLVQGMAIFEVDGESRIALSTSYGLSNSHILIYDFDSLSTGTATIDGTSRTVYYIDSSVLLEDYEIPSMSEGMCTVGNRVYVLFESAGDKYKLFVRERLSNVYSFRYRSTT